MAEIRVEPKKQSSSSNWIWIVLVLLIAAAAVYYFLTRDNTAGDTTQPADTTSAVLHSPASVATLHHQSVMYL